MAKASAIYIRHIGEIEKLTSATGQTFDPIIYAACIVAEAIANVSESSS